MDIGGETAGLITYMRTDGVQMAPEAIDAARAPSIKKEFGEKLPAGKAAHLFHQGEERAGSARGDPPDRLRSGRRPQVKPVSRRRPVPALRPDLEARRSRAR
jgi:hypothetical protein